MPDPLLDSGGSSPESDSPHDGDSDHCVVTNNKHMCTDSSSGDDLKGMSSSGNSIDGSKNGFSSDGKPISNQAGMTEASSKAETMTKYISKLPPDIARSGGICHNVTATAMPPAASLPNGHAKLSRAPITALPPLPALARKLQSHNSPTNFKTTRSHPTCPICP